MCRNCVSKVAGEICTVQIAVMLHCWQDEILQKMLRIHGDRVRSMTTSKPHNFLELTSFPTQRPVTQFS